MVAANSIGPKATRIVAVGGGKGGVGKSIISANLSVAMAQAGQKVILIDGDLGAANLHTMFGLVRPEKTILDFLTRDIKSLIDAGISTLVPNLTLIPGAGAVPGVANINYGQKQRLLRHIQELEADVVVLDVGAGTSYNVVDLFDVADIRLCVITPQVPAMVNAYAFLKASVYRVITKLMKKSDCDDFVSTGLSAAETERVADILTHVEKEDPKLAARIKAALEHFGARVVGNQLYVDKDLRQIHAIARMAKDFLGLEVPVLGYLWRSQTVHDSISRRQPYMVASSSDGNVPAIRKMAKAILAENIKSLRKGREWTDELGQVVDLSTCGPIEPVESSQYVESYVQRADRYAVNWKATFQWTDGEVQVHVLDVSMDGALVSGKCDLDLGARGFLVFEDLPGGPQVEVEVRNVQSYVRQIGLQFVGRSDIAAQIVEAAKSLSQ